MVVRLDGKMEKDCYFEKRSKIATSSSSRRLRSGSPSSMPCGHALLDVRLHHREADAVERRLSRGELLKNFDAQARLLHHPPDPADLAFDPVQAGDECLLLGCIQHEAYTPYTSFAFPPGDDGRA